DRAALGDALRRLGEANVPLDGASDHGVSEALYLHDPDGNGLELYWDRPRDAWPRAADGTIDMVTRRLDVEALLEAARRPRPAAPTPAPPAIAPATRTRLNDLRTRLLALHKALLEDAKSQYEMDRARVNGPGALLQLVISDPWFAWLHQISEIIVRIDGMTVVDSTSTEADARALVEQIDKLLVPSENGDAFARRYFEAIQRQPAVVLAHGDVKRVRKAPQRRGAGPAATSLARQLQRQPREADMRWTAGNRDNIEDQRGGSGGGRMIPLGIGGFIIVALLSMYTGVDFFSLLGGGSA